MTITKSTQVITDLITLQMTAPTAATLVKASTAGTDINGMVELANQQAADLVRALIIIEGVTDSADGNLLRVQDLLAVLV